MSIPNNNLPNTTATGLADWDEVIANPDPGVAELLEGGIYRAKVVGLTMENSKKYPGTQYPRLKFFAFDERGDIKPLSWIPRNNSEILPAIEAIDPDARKKPMQAIVGQECCVKVALARGVTATEVLPTTALPGPTLAEGGWL